MDRPNLVTDRAHPEPPMVGNVEHGAKSRCGSCSWECSVPNLGQFDADRPVCDEERPGKADAGTVEPGGIWTPWCGGKRHITALKGLLM